MTSILSGAEFRDINVNGMRELVGKVWRENPVTGVIRRLRDSETALYDPHFDPEGESVLLEETDYDAPNIQSCVGRNGH